MSTDDGRRERYAAAIETAIGEWETGEPTWLTLEERVADAAMAVADAEAAELLEEIDTYRQQSNTHYRVLADEQAENARLRAELEAANAATAEAGNDNARIAGLYHSANATIERVRSVLDDDEVWESIPTWLRTQLRAALEGEQ